MVMGLKRDRCWPDEVDSSTNHGARRRSVWLAPRASWATDEPLDHCLWMYVENKCEGIVNTMNITQSCMSSQAVPLKQAEYLGLTSEWIILCVIRLAAPIKRKTMAGMAHTGSLR
jgi:hypothetical protein